MPAPKRDFLYQLIHPTIPGFTMTFDPWGPGSESDFSRPGSTYVVPGANSPIDAMGDAANSMSARTFQFQFIRPYKSVSGIVETFTEAQDEFKRMVAHGKRMTAVLKTTQGTLRYGRFKLTGLSSKPNVDDDVAAIFSATFDMNPPWWRDLYPANAVIYDTSDLTYDVGDHTYDDDGYALTLVSNSIFIDNTKASLPDYGATFALYGNFGGDVGIQIRNISINPPMYMYLHVKLTTPNMLVIESATEAVRYNGGPRPDLLSLPRGQFDVMNIEAGIINELKIECLGANPILGGYITVETVNKYA